jgi:3-oxoacyl-[acyl-carrier protein] reductase
MNSNKQTGKVALVTGAGRGLGKAIAKLLAAKGCTVALNYSVSEDQAEITAGQIESQGGRAGLYAGDVSDGAAVKNMVRHIVKDFGGIDILVNNAGITRDKMLLHMPDTAWDDVIKVNLKGPYLCSKYCLRYMLERGWGRIINIASVAGLIGNAGQANYSASKGGLIALTKSMAREVGAKNITVNAIAPGFILTEMTDKMSDEFKTLALERTALKRFGKPEDVAELAVFLASEEAGYITAQIISVDGGLI